MAEKKALQNLLEVTPPDQIIDSDEVVGRISLQMVGDEDFGLQCDGSQFILMRRKESGRTGTKDDGVNEGKVIRYKRWESVGKYPSTYWQAMKCYMDYRGLDKLSKVQNGTIDDIKKINLDTQKVVCDTLRSCVKYEDIKEVCNLLDVKQKISEQVCTLNDEVKTCKKLMKEIERFHADIKEKHKIIVEVDKPKKHKIKEEND